MRLRHDCRTKQYMKQERLLNNIENLVDVGDCFVLRVLGYSMLPMLGHCSDKIVVRRIGPEHDIMHRIAMFRTPQNKIIVHRVIAVQGDEVVLQGDGNLYEVERCSRAEIVGVVESVRRRGGREISCTTKKWQRRERLWLSQPLFVRRCVLAIMRRWFGLKIKLDKYGY